MDVKSLVTVAQCTASHHRVATALIQMKSFIISSGEDIHEQVVIGVFHTHPHTAIILCSEVRDGIVIGVFKIHPIPADAACMSIDDGILIGLPEKESHFLVTGNVAQYQGVLVGTPQRDPHVIVISHDVVQCDPGDVVGLVVQIDPDGPIGYGHVLHMHVAHLDPDTDPIVGLDKRVPDDLHLLVDLNVLPVGPGIYLDGMSILGSRSIDGLLNEIECFPGIEVLN